MGNHPRIKTQLPGPRSSDILKRDQQFVSSSYFRTYPMVVESGKGCITVDVDGNEFIDLGAGVAVLQTGHGHPTVLRAVQEELQKIQHYPFAGIRHRTGVELAERLCKLMPGKFAWKVAYGNSGTEAVESGLKLAKWHAKKPRFLAFTGGFHGRTHGSLACTADRIGFIDHFFPFMPGVTHVPYPYCYRCVFKLEPSSCGFHCIDFIAEEVLGKYVPPDEVAAAIFEPIQGETGYVVPPKGYFSRLKELTDKHSILLIDDEVQTGIGRSGKWWAIEHYDIVPDVICFAKGIASGFPLGGAIAKADVMDWAPGSHYSTFGGNPISCAAALATLEIIEKERLLDNATKLGQYIQDRLNEMAEKYDIIGDIRGKGLMIGVELVKDRRTKQPAIEETQKVLMGCLQKGVIVLRGGKSTVRMCPPLIITEELASSALDILDKVFQGIR